jgi:putative PIN family toxin of toxin-antitoxin system
MKVLIDTNIFLISIPSKSPYHEIIQAFNRRVYQLIITTPIFLEYEEILTDKANSLVAKNVLSALLEAPNVIGTEIFCHWDIITADFDDNKFTDAYISGDADYLVTHDAHFNKVKQMGFPKINIITANEFLSILREVSEKNPS